MFEYLQTILQILQEKAQEIKLFEREAELKLYEKDVEGRREALTKKAKILIELPVKLETEIGRENIPSKVWTHVLSFATMAKEDIKEDNYFGMGVLLIDKGSKKGEKNNLEKLINWLESPGLE